MSLSQTIGEKALRTSVRVRRYVAEDMDALCNKVMAEVPLLPHYAGIKVEAGRLCQILRAGLDDETSFMCRVLVTPDNEIVGGVCGYCVTQLLSWDKMTGDIFLYIDPDYRSLQNVLRLMMAYRDWGVERGATIISATQTGGYKQETLGKLLERFGDYVPVGTIYYYRPKITDTIGVQQ